MLNDLKILLGIPLEDTTEDDLLNLLIRKSEDKIRQRLYPYNPDKKEIPEQYNYRILDIAVYLYNRRGVEGQISHKEGDISRGYSTPDVPDEMVADIIPFVGVIR